MKMKDLRELSPEQLREHVADRQRELSAVREAVRVGKEKNTARIRALKSEVARGQGALLERSV